MASDRSNRYRQRAFRHEARAHNFRGQADLLLQRDDDFDCAGALLYEAAKQCINAVANQRGENPGTVGGKVGIVRDTVAEVPDGHDLIRYWQGADKLHIHADRGRAFSKSLGHPRKFRNPGGRRAQDVLDSGFRRNDDSGQKAAIRDFGKAL